MNKDIILTEDQSRVFENIQEWLLNGTDRYKTLKGYAGTGKTTLLDFIVAFAKDNDMPVCVTATTNKAVAVLREKVQGADLMTIHSALSIKAKKKGPFEYFEPVNFNKGSLSGYKLIIIDECSMVSCKDKKEGSRLVKSLKKIIDESLQDTDIKVLFCGDPAQLPPIGEPISETFSYNPEELTEVVRYGNEIAKVAEQVRNYSGLFPHVKLESPGFIDVTVQLELLHHYKSKFMENPDSIRTLCWTNKKVDHWNKVIRSILFPKADRFVEGDRIVAINPCFSGTGRHKSVLLNNSQEAVVLDAKSTMDSWELDILTDEGSAKKVRIVHEKYASVLADKLQKLADRKRWSEFWDIKETYHDIKHAYAMTVHKSQGSTFDRVALDLSDIGRNITDEYNKLIYVGLTRASKQVLLLP